MDEWAGRIHLSARVCDSGWGQAKGHALEQIPCIEISISGIGTCGDAASGSSLHDGAVHLVQGNGLIHTRLLSRLQQPVQVLVQLVEVPIDQLCGVKDGVTPASEGWYQVARTVVRS